MNKIISLIFVAMTMLSGISYYIIKVKNPSLSRATITTPHSLVSVVNSVQSQWTAAPTNNPDFNWKMLCGVKKQVGAELNKNYKTIPVAANIPTTFDARVAWPDCSSIQEIRNQANCGSCWAFGAVEAMSDRICINSGQKDQTRISAENLVACCSSCGDGCNGGDLAPSWSYWQETGIVTGDVKGTKGVCQPYFADCIYDNGQGDVSPNMCPNNTEPPTPACSNKCQAGYPIPYTQDLHFGVSAYSITNDIAQIQTEIMTNGPVEAAFDVYEDFTQYKSGVYKHVTGSFLGGHAIKILGWGVENGVNYWLVANSWTTTWGMKGFFMIQRGTDECGIEDDINAGMPKY